MVFNIAAIARKSLNARQFHQVIERRWMSQNSGAVIAEAQTTGASAQSTDNTEELIKCEKDGPITIISLNRPQFRNAINREMAEKLCATIECFENDNTSSVAVLHGIGGSFSVGYDMQELLTVAEKPETLFSSEGTVGPTRRMIKKPMVCGISGFCISNGLALALMCDLRVMEEDATLGFFNRRFGVPLMDGCTARLPALIGLSRTLDLVMTGRPIMAKEALDIGLVNRIVAPGTALGQAVNLANCISKFPQESLGHDRNAVYSSVFDRKSFDQSLQNEIMTINKEVIKEMLDGVKLFNDGTVDGETYKYFKEKRMADWEQAEYNREKLLCKNQSDECK